MKATEANLGELFAAYDDSDATNDEILEKLFLTVQHCHDTASEALRQREFDVAFRHLTTAEELLDESGTDRKVVDVQHRPDVAHVVRTLRERSLTLIRKFEDRRTRQVPTNATSASGGSRRPSSGGNRTRLLPANRPPARDVAGDPRWIQPEPPRGAGHAAMGLDDGIYEDDTDDAADSLIGDPVLKIPPHPPPDAAARSGSPMDRIRRSAAEGIQQARVKSLQREERRRDSSPILRLADDIGDTLLRANRAKKQAEIMKQQSLDRAKRLAEVRSARMKKEEANQAAHLLHLQGDFELQRTAATQRRRAAEEQLAALKKHAEEREAARREKKRASQLFGSSERFPTAPPGSSDQPGAAARAPIRSALRAENVALRPHADPDLEEKKAAAEGADAVGVHSEDVSVQSNPTPPLTPRSKPPLAPKQHVTPLSLFAMRRPEADTSGGSEGNSSIGSSNSFDARVLHMRELMKASPTPEEHPAEERASPTPPLSGPKGRPPLSPVDAHLQFGGAPRGTNRVADVLSRIERLPPPPVAIVSISPASSPAASSPIQGAVQSGLDSTDRDTLNIDDIPEVELGTVNALATSDLGLAVPLPQILLTTTHKLQDILAAVRIQRFTRGLLARKEAQRRKTKLHILLAYHYPQVEAVRVLVRFLKFHTARSLAHKLQSRVAYLIEQRVEVEKARDGNDAVADSAPGSPHLLASHSQSHFAAFDLDQSTSALGKSKSELLALSKSGGGWLRRRSMMPRQSNTSKFHNRFHRKSMEWNALNRIQRSVAAQRIQRYWRDYLEYRLDTERAEAHHLMRFVTCRTEELSVHPPAGAGPGRKGPAWKRSSDTATSDGEGSLVNTFSSAKGFSKTTAFASGDAASMDFPYSVKASAGDAAEDSRIGDIEASVTASPKRRRKDLPFVSLRNVKLSKLAADEHEAELKRQQHQHALEEALAKEADRKRREKQLASERAVLLQRIARGYRLRLTLAAARFHAHSYFGQALSRSASSHISRSTSFAAMPHAHEEFSPVPAAIHASILETIASRNPHLIPAKRLEIRNAQHRAALMVQRCLRARRSAISRTFLLQQRAARRIQRVWLSRRQGEAVQWRRSLLRRQMLIQGMS